VLGKKRNIKIKNARKVLLLVWLGFFLLNLAVVLFYFLAWWIELDNFTAALKQLSASFAPYLGVMLLFYWGRAGKGKTIKAGLSFWVALLGSIIWNGLIFIFILVGPIEDALESTRDIGVLLAWLVAGAIVTFFPGTKSQMREKYFIQSLPGLLSVYLPLFLTFCHWSENNPHYCV
jgi:hypothetical protein